MVSPTTASSISADTSLNAYVAGHKNPQFAQNLALHRPSSLAAFHAAPEQPAPHAEISAPRLASDGSPLVPDAAAGATPDATAQTAAPDATAQTAAPDATAQTAAPDATVPAAETGAAPYQVVRGDNLSKIAKAHGLSLKQLLDLNKDKLKGRDINLIYPGETFNVTPPAGEQAAPSQTTPRRPADAAPGGAATPPAGEQAAPSQTTPRRPADAAPGGAATPPAGEQAAPSQTTPRRPADAAPGGGATPPAGAAPAGEPPRPATDAPASDFPLGDFGSSAQAPVVRPDRGQASAPKYAAQPPQPRGGVMAPKAPLAPADVQAPAMALSAPVVRPDRGQASAPKFAAQPAQPRGGVMAPKAETSADLGPGTTTAVRG